MGAYEGKIAVVTGARKGLGRAIAGHLLDQGARVLGLGREPAENAHPAYSHYRCDVRDAEAVRATFRQIGRDVPALHLLVNNSGVLTSQHSILLAASSAEEMLMTNLLGPFLVSREAAKLMKRTPGGRIVHVGSMAAALEPSGDSIYAACKAGLETLANVLAKEYAGFGITSNTVAVTAIETDMLQKLPRDVLDGIIARLPIPRYAVEDDVMNVIDFFASERSGYITAQTVYLGGLHR